MFVLFVKLGHWDYHYCTKCRNEATESRAIHIPIHYRDLVHAAIRNEDHNTLKELRLISSSESVVTLHLVYCKYCYNTARVTVDDADRDSIGAVPDEDLRNRPVTGQMAKTLILLAEKAKALRKKIPG